jgi:hypothetical protein
MNKPLLPLSSGESPYRGKDVDITKYVRFGVITRVDYETGYVDVDWLEGTGFSPLVKLPLSFSSLRSSIRGMPEEGSVIICGWSRQSQTWEDPVILGFIDLDLETLLEYRLLRNNKTAENLKQIKTIREKIGYNVVRGKRRKIYPGEIQLESSPGAELYLDEDVYLSDSKLNEIEIRSADRSIRFSANQIYSLTQASRTWNGMICREPGNLSFDFQPTVLPNGQKVQFVTDSNNPFHMGGKAFNEHRTELYELSTGIMKASEVNAGYDVNPLSPFITFVLGTLAGNDKTDTAKYTKVLRPQVFGTPSASEVSLDYIECMPEEYKVLASTLHFRHQSRVQIDIDKEGHLFTFFPASTGRHPLGPGRSWEAGFDGSVKFVVGAENIDNQSIFLDTKGGIKASLGSDKQGKSISLVCSKGIDVQVMAPAADSFAYSLKTQGNYQAKIDGNYDLEVTGNYTVLVRGKTRIDSLATREENFINDKNNIYGGSYKKIVVKDKQEQIGYNKVLQITGNLERAPGVFTPALTNETSDKYDLMTGSRDESYLNGNLRRTLTFGNMETSLTKGDIKETIVLGNRYLTITTGNQEDKITTGSNKLSITTGNDETKIVTGDIKREITTKNAVGFSDKITTGNHETEITTGNHSIKVQAGDIKREITTKNSVGFSDKITTGNHETEVVTGDIKRKVTTKSSVGMSDTITTGNHQTTVTTGDITRTITTKSSVGFKDEIKVGNHQTTVTTGDKKETIKTGSSTEDISVGSKKVTIKTGDFLVNITSGNIDIKTKTGKVKVSTATQTVDINGMSTVTVKSNTKLKLVGPQVEIGQMPTKGGVVCGIPGAFSTVCYITGTPPMGSKTVKATI